MLKWFTTKTTIAVLGVLFVVVTPLSIWALTGGTSNLLGLVRIFADSSFTTPNVATAAGELYVEGDLEADGNLNVAGTSTLTGNTTVTGDVTVTGNDIAFGNGGTVSNATNGAITIGEASEDLICTFTPNVATYTSSSGVAEINYTSIALQSATVATHLATIRFCGNGISGATPSYMGPVLLDDTEADLVFGGAGCDALDNTTEATADAPWHAAFAFKPVAMVCVGVCTGASAANDAITYQLRDDAADVTGMACTATAWSGDNTPSQCTVRDPTPATVAANSAIAIKMSGTDDACTDAGDDFECLLYVTF